MNVPSAIAIINANLLVYFCWIVLPLSAQENAEPQPVQEAQTRPPLSEHPFDRYLPLVQRAPFGPGAAPVVPERSFADNYYLASTARFGEELMAVIVDRMTNTRIQLTDSQPAQGIRLVSVEQGDTFKSTRVILEKNGERGTVTYDLGMLQQGYVQNDLTNMPQQLGHPAGVSQAQPPPANMQQGPSTQMPPSPNRVIRRRIIVPKQP